MATVAYDRKTNEQQQMIHRVEHVLARMNERIEFLWDADRLGVDALADSESILKDAHRIGFSPFQWVGVEKVGQWYRTRFRLR
jgi:hypothetical protein